jgi:hypothetical protein
LIADTAPTRGELNLDDLSYFVDLLRIFYLILIVLATEKLWRLVINFTDYLLFHDLFLIILVQRHMVMIMVMYGVLM